MKRRAKNFAESAGEGVWMISAAFVTDTDIISAKRDRECSGVHFQSPDFYFAT
jgi:hypothetical protein